MKCRNIDSVLASQIDIDIEYAGIITIDCQFIEPNNA